MDANEHQLRKKFVLIDDDPSYRAIILRVASFERMEVDVFESLTELGSVGLLGGYDVAIVDYDLGGPSGIEIAEYLSALFGDIPMILISERERAPSEKAWPANIKKFIKKSQGYGYTLREANKIAQMQKPRATDGLRTCVPS